MQISLRQRSVLKPDLAIPYLRARQDSSLPNFPRRPTLSSLVLALSAVRISNSHNFLVTRISLRRLPSATPTFPAHAFRAPLVSAKHIFIQSSSVTSMVFKDPR